MFILSLVHVVRLILPLLIIPILTRRIDASDFGVYMYAISFSAWLAIFVEYGFNISSTREIACAENEEKIFDVVAGTQTGKFLLILLTIPLLFVAIFAVPVFESETYWAITAWLLGILTAFAPIYYFQGREKLKIVGFAEITSGLFMLAAVYFFVQTKEDFYLLAIIVVMARFLSVAVLNWKMYAAQKKLRFQFFNFKEGRSRLKSGFNIFVFQAAVSLYTSFNVVFLGFFCSPVQVGVYAAAERLMRAGIGFLGQFSNAIFPRLNALKTTNPEKMNKLRLQVLLGFFVIGIVGMGLTWLIAPFIVRYMFGEQATEVTEIIRILAFTVPAIALSNVLGFQYLLVDRREKTFNIIISGAAVVNIAMAYYFISFYQEKGMAIAWVSIEWLITIVIAATVFKISRNKKLITTG